MKPKEPILYQMTFIYLFVFYHRKARIFFLNVHYIEKLGFTRAPESPLKRFLMNKK